MFMHTFALPLLRASLLAQPPAALLLATVQLLQPEGSFLRLTSRRCTSQSSAWQPLLLLN